MAEHLERAAALVTVSSTAVLEAVASGVPAVVIDEFGVSPEAHQHGVRGQRTVRRRRGGRRVARAAPERRMARRQLLPRPRARRLGRPASASCSSVVPRRPCPCAIAATTSRAARCAGPSSGKRMLGEFDRSFAGRCRWCSRCRRGGSCAGCARLRRLLAGEPTTPQLGAREVRAAAARRRRLRRLRDDCADSGLRSTGAAPPGTSRIRSAFGDRRPRDPAELDAVDGVALDEQRGHVVRDRLPGESESLRDLAVAEAAHDEVEHVALARRESERVRDARSERAVPAVAVTPDPSTTAPSTTAATAASISEGIASFTMYPAAPASSASRTAPSSSNIVITTTRVAGRSPTIRAVASTPDPSGSPRSMSTTSGAVVRASAIASADPAASPTTS